MRLWISVCSRSRDEGVSSKEQVLNTASAYLPVLLQRPRAGAFIQLPYLHPERCGYQLKLFRSLRNTSVEICCPPLVEAASCEMKTIEVVGRVRDQIIVRIWYETRLYHHFVQACRCISMGSSEWRHSTG